MKSISKKFTALLVAFVVLSGGGVVRAESTPFSAGFLPVRALFEGIYEASVDWDYDDRSIHINSPVSEGEVSGIIALIEQQGLFELHMLLEMFELSMIMLFAEGELAYVFGIPVALKHGVVIWNNLAFIHPDDVRLLFGAFFGVLDEAWDLVWDAVWGQGWSGGRQDGDAGSDLVQL